MQTCNISMEDARSRIWMVDSKGLITATRADVAAGKLPEHKKPFVRTDGTPDMQVGSGKHGRVGGRVLGCGVCV